MATNPMQRKARNSFLLGMLVMLLLASIAIGLLLMKLMEFDKKEKESEKAIIEAYVLAEDVSSGQIITTDMLKKQKVDSTLVPSNVTTDKEVIDNYALQDKEGNNIGTKYDKDKNVFLYIRKENKDCLVEKETGTDNNYYLQKDNQNNYICIEKDNNNNIIFYIENDNRRMELKEDSDGYYFETNREKNYLNVSKEYIELNNVPLIAKVTMKKNTLITTDLLSKGDSTMQKDVRKQEYNMLVLPMDLVTGDYIDIRLMLPTGQDYIVIAKKEVEIPVVGGKDSSDTIWINLSEDEILHMSCAIIEAYKINGAKLYATKYTEAGIQEAAIPTYPVNANTSALLERDPNILDKAMNEIRSRYNQTNGPALRNDYINTVINSQGDQAESNYQTNMSESITNSKKTRQEYLDSLSGGAQ